MSTMHEESVTDRAYWTRRLDESACCSDESLAGGLGRLKSRAAVSISMLSGPALHEVTTAATSLPFRRAGREAGKPRARVYQEFDYCGTVPAGHPLRHLGSWFEGRLRRALSLMAAPPIEPDFTINDVVCQRYHTGELGISPHRDHLAYTGLIALLVLAGRGRYFVCADRQGRDRREIDARPGRVILMPGPGYAGRRDRPFHMVGDIIGERYSVGLRHDARESG